MCSLPFSAGKLSIGFTPKLAVHVVPPPYTLPTDPFPLYKGIAKNLVFMEKKSLLDFWQNAGTFPCWSTLFILTLTQDKFIKERFEHISVNVDLLAYKPALYNLLSLSLEP